MNDSRNSSPKEESIDPHGPSLNLSNCVEVVCVLMHLLQHVIPVFLVTIPPHKMDLAQSLCSMD